MSLGIDVIGGGIAWTGVLRRTFVERKCETIRYEISFDGQTKKAIKTLIVADIV